MDTTLLADDDFGASVAAAARRMTTATPIQPPGQIIDDPKAFAILVDVSDTIRRGQIVPI